MEAIYYQIFEALPRQGPGDSAATRRAFQSIGHLPARACILDVGCGAGMQTIDLARLSNGRIFALDNHRPFLATLRQHARQAGIGAGINSVQGDMTEMPFAAGSFDLIWSEGAAYFLGLENALAQWRGLLRPGGFVVISHVAWFKVDPPPALRAFWEEEFPEIDTDAGNQAAIAGAGYTLVNHFVLAPEAWWPHYYRPMAAVIAAMRGQYAENEAVQTILAAFEREIDMHRRYGDYYGYYFYVMRS